MILLLSAHSDISTIFVEYWLMHYKSDYIKLYSEDDIQLEYESSSKSLNLKINDYTICHNDISAFWNRRGAFNFGQKLAKTTIEMLNKAIHLYQLRELLGVQAFVHHSLNPKYIIGNFFADNENKLIVCDLAQKHGLIVPEYIITSQKIALIKFYTLFNTIITKNAISSFYYTHDDIAFSNYTTLLNRNDIDLLPDNFFPSFCQVYKEKKYELRIFYLHGEFYSMAIFSQLDEHTKIDYRHYDNPKANHCVPFNLPTKIKHQLNAFMVDYGLNSGSIDMIVTPENEYVFLEVNPVGQFGMVSYPCNYYLEKKIASYLSGQPINE